MNWMEILKSISNVLPETLRTIYYSVLVLIKAAFDLILSIVHAACDSTPVGVFISRIGISPDTIAFIITVCLFVYLIYVLFRITILVLFFVFIYTTMYTVNLNKNIDLQNVKQFEEIQNDILKK